MRTPKALGKYISIITIMMIVSACNQPYSQQPSVTNTPIDTSLFATPLTGATQMTDVEIFATGTAAALQTTTEANSYEATVDQNITQSDAVGKLETEYPAQMMPLESETVLVYISVPSQFVNVDLETLTRVPIPDTGTVPIELLNKFSINILIAEHMRVVLSSPSFQVDDLIQSSQIVNIDIVGWVTSWAWTIRAPQEYGTQVFTIRVYLLDDEVPSWLGSFNVNVVSPSSTPEPTETPTLTPAATLTLTPTLTPLPVLVKIRDQIVNSISLEVCLGIPATLVVVLSLIDQIRKMLKKKKQTTKRNKN